MRQLLDDVLGHVRLKGAARLTVFAALLPAATTGSLGAQGSANTRASTTLVPAGSAKFAEASRLGSSSVSFDGALDDAAWRQATFISDFVQKEPTEGGVPSERTEVAFLFDDGVLYVGARMYANPDSVAAQSSRKDQDNGNAAMLRISLDTYHDRRTAYTFAVTAAGVRLDWYNSSDNEFNRDMTYDPVWQAKTRIDSLGWTAELAIPLSQLRFNAGQPVWGLNVTRIIPNRNEHIYWSYIPRDENGWSSKFGALDGMDDLTPKRRVEFLPFVASEARITSSELVADGNPFEATREIQGRVGANLKMGFGPNLTLDATVLPDFGQVDADPAEVNLSAFETIFPERRPFFTEGNQLLRGRGSMPTYYNSRRIGAPPRGSVPGEYSTVPDVTTILGAAKLTGRLESGLSIGALGALTQREYGRFTTPTGDIDQREVEPMTAFGIVRVQQEFGADASTAGLTLTGVSRDFDSFAMRSQLNKQAVTGGGDFTMRFQGGKYEIRGHAGFSHIAGDSGAITSAQTSSARYYQRPDQNYVTFDPNRTSLTGYSASLQASKNAGKHWLWGTGVWADSPGLELNDIGVIRRADDIQSWFFLNYRETEPGKVFRRYNFWMNPSVGFNFGGVRKNTALWTGGNVTWNNYMWNNFNLSYQPSTMNDALTRGGPLMGDVGGWRARLSWGNNRAANTNWSVGGGINDVNHNQSINAFASIGAQPSPQLQFSVGPSIFAQNNGRQYYTVRGEGSAATFGTRYIFSTIKFSQISAQFRVNYLFTPTLSLELYAEPFVASGNYSNFGELEAARSSELRTYGTDGTTITPVINSETGLTDSYNVTDGGSAFSLPNNNFNITSFRSNLVLRWEWSPGSTVFFVWQQNKSGFAPDGSPLEPGALFNAVTSPGQNIIAIKANYWIPIN
jgi:hypothetical protein